MFVQVGNITIIQFDVFGWLRLQLTLRFGCFYKPHEEPDSILYNKRRLFLTLITFGHGKGLAV